MDENKLSCIKEIAHSLLDIEPVANEEFPFIINHPFIANNPIVVKNDGQYKMIDIFNDKKEYQKYISDMKKNINKKKSFSEILFLLNKPYHLVFFYSCKDIISPMEYNDCLSHIWVCTEFPNNDKNVSKEQILKLFNKSDPTNIMSKEEKKIYDNLPDVVEIYRGTHYEDDSKALSWTIDFETAKWFATRFDNDGYVLKAKVNKKDIFAFFDGRNEKEVVINYKKLKELTIEKVMKIDI